MKYVFQAKPYAHISIRVVDFRGQHSPHRHERRIALME